MGGRRGSRRVDPQRWAGAHRRHHEGSCTPTSSAALGSPGSLPHPVAYPLGEVPDDELALGLDVYQMPDPYHAGRFDSPGYSPLLPGRSIRLGKLGMCLFERAWSIRGMDKILTE